MGVSSTQLSLKTSWKGHGILLSLTQSEVLKRELEVRTLGEADRNLPHHWIDCDLPQALALA